MSRRRRPDRESLKDSARHSADNRGASGRFGDIFNKEVEKWEPDEGEHEFAIFPFYVENGMKSPFRWEGSKLNKPFDDEERTDDYKLSVYVHYGVGHNQDSILCPRSINKKCPLCEEKDRLMDMGYTWKDEEVREVSSSKKVLYNIVVFDTTKEFEKGIQIWMAPHASIEDILSKIKAKEDRETGEMVDRMYFIPEEGWNVAFEREGKRGSMNTKYVQVEIVQRRSSDEFTEKELDNFYDDAHDLEALVEIKDYDEIYEMHFGVKPDEDNKSRYNEDKGRDREKLSDRRKERDGSSGRGRGRDRKERGRGRDREDKEERGRGRGHDREERGGREERSRSHQDRGEREDRGREGKGRDREETRERGRGRGCDREDKEEKPKDEYPTCFGLDYQQLDECEDCPIEMFEKCAEEYKKR